jgi:hypothetical protein
MEALYQLSYSPVGRVDNIPRPALGKIRASTEQVLGCRDRAVTVLA